MKLNLKSNHLLYLTAACGAMGALLRAWQYSTGLDEENLLSPAHPAGILVFIFSVAVIATLFWFTRGATARAKYARQFPASPIAAAGAFCGAAGLLVTAMITLVRREESFYFITGIVGILAAGALVFTGFCRLKGRRPSFVFHTTVCVYFIFRLLSRYQNWSADPQLHDYCFQLLATVCAMLFSFHRASLDLKVTHRRRLMLLGLAGGYFGCLSLVYTDAFWLYLGTSAWMLTNLGSVKTAFPAQTQQEDRP